MIITVTTLHTAGSGYVAKGNLYDPPWSGSYEIYESPN